ncbi:nucleolin, partial [Reticulomyxa filosa]
MDSLDIAYKEFVQYFKKLCDTVHVTQDLLEVDEEEIEKKGSGFERSIKKVRTKILPDDLLLASAKLAMWIYTPDDMELFDKETYFQAQGIFLFGRVPPALTYGYVCAKKKKGGRQLAQWALVISKSARKGFVVFKGTGSDKIFDMVVNTGVVPMPIQFKDCHFSNESDGHTLPALAEVVLGSNKKSTTANEKKEDEDEDEIDNDTDDDDDDDDDNEGQAETVVGKGNSGQNPFRQASKKEESSDQLYGFSVHSGMYASVLRDFQSIRKSIRANQSQFDELIVTGHSLGMICIRISVF